MTVTIIAILAFATLIRSAFGFGEALIAVPLLALLIPVEIAAPTAALVSVTVAAAVILQDWAEIDRAAALRLVLATLPGIPIGLLLLTHLPDAFVKAALAALIIGFATFSLTRRQARTWADDRFAWLFGVAAGVLGGAYGMNGPPLVVYGTFRGWSPAQFRATLQGYFLPASSVGLAGYWLAGLWTPPVTHYYLVSLPAVAVAIATGRWLNRRMEPQRFFRIVDAGLILVGTVLLAQALRSQFLLN